MASLPTSRASVRDASGVWSVALRHDSTATHQTAETGHPDRFTQPFVKLVESGIDRLTLHRP